MSHSKRRSHKDVSKKRPLIIGLGLSLGLIVLAGLGYAYQANTYQTQFLPNTYIGDLNVSRLTADEVNQKLNKTYNNLSFTLLLNNQEWQSIKKTEFGLHTDFSEKLTQLLDKQNPWSWGGRMVSGKETLDLGEAAFDEKQLDERYAQLEADLTKWNQTLTPTKDATLTLGEDGFSITPEIQGETIDVAKALTAAKEQLLSGNSTLELNEFVKKPSVTADDPTLKEELAQITRIATVEATYVINGVSFQIPSELIEDWIIYQEGNVTLDREKVYQYVTQLGADYNTSTNPSNFNSTLRGEVSVPAGSLSWTIAPDSETDALMADILAGEAFSRSPIAQGSANAGSPLFGATYIEVDMVNQYMWYYKDGKVMLETDIVTGKPTTLTPAGVFYVWNKARDEVLRGVNDDGSKYASPVDYWLPIDWTGVGIHDSDWQPAYGGELWRTVGSHGCINTPPGVMKELYEMVEVGTPVLVF